MKITYRVPTGNGSVVAELPDRTSVLFDAGPTADRTSSGIEVVFCRASDGTIGIEIMGMQGPLRIEPRATNRLYVTTQRPDRLKPKDQS